MSKLPEANLSGWYYVDIGADSGIASLDRTEGSTQRQRVYYSRYGTMWELNYDGDSYQSRTMLPSPPSGTSFTNGAVAATQWDDSSGHHTAVGAIASNGRVCVWEGGFSTGYQSAQCTNTGVAYQYSPDISAAATYDASGNGTPAFFYRRADYHLGARIRTAAFFSYYWPGSDLGVPSGSSYIYPSVVAVRSVAQPDRFEVVVGANGQLRSGRMTTGGSVTWVSLPTLPASASVAYRTAALSITPYTYYQWPTGYVSPLALFVLGTDGALYRIHSTTTGAWSQSWETGSAGTAATPADESWLSNGAAIAEGLSWSQTPVLWGAGGSRPGSRFSGTLQKFSEAGQFDDHLNYFHYQQQVLGRIPGGSTIATTEGTTAITGEQGLSTGIRRNSPPPWRIGLSDTSVGGADFSDDFVVALTEGWADPDNISTSDPYAVVERDTGRMHLTTLEARVTLSPTIPDACTVPQNGQSQRVVYRRGGSASQIASMTTPGSDMYVIHATPGYADHEAMTLTRNSSGTSTHIIFNQILPNNATGTPAGIYLWTLSFSGTTDEVWLSDPADSPNTLPAQPPGIFSDAAGTVFAWTEAYDHLRRGLSPGFPTICSIGTNGRCSGNHGVIAPAGNAPAVAAPLVHFSLSGEQGAPKSGCVTAPFGTPVLDPTRNCFETAEPFAFAADPNVPGRLYAVYQGTDIARGPDAVSVYFTMHEETKTIREWTTPIRVNGSAPASHLFVDPEITVDGEGTIIVSYTEVEDDMDGSIGRPNYVAWSTDGGGSFQEQTLWDTWKPWDLPYHCLRRIHFLGEYEHGSTVGGRGYHNFHVSVSNQVIRGGFLASRWAIRN